MERRFAAIVLSLLLVAESAPARLPSANRPTMCDQALLRKEAFANRVLHQNRTLKPSPLAAWETRVFKNAIAPQRRGAAIPFVTPWHEIIDTIRHDAPLPDHAVQTAIETVLVIALWWMSPAAGLYAVTLGGNGNGKWPKRLAGNRPLREQLQPAEAVALRQLSTEALAERLALDSADARRLAEVLRSERIWGVTWMALFEDAGIDPTDSLVTRARNLLATERPAPPAPAATTSIRRMSDFPAPSLIRAASVKTAVPLDPRLQALDLKGATLTRAAALLTSSDDQFNERLRWSEALQSLRMPREDALESAFADDRQRGAIEGYYGIARWLDGIWSLSEQPIQYLASTPLDRINKRLTSVGLPAAVAQAVVDQLGVLRAGGQMPHPLTPGAWVAELQTMDQLALALGAFDRPHHLLFRISQSLLRLTLQAIGARYDKPGDGVLWLTGAEIHLYLQAMTQTAGVRMNEALSLPESAAPIALVLARWAGLLTRPLGFSPLEAINSYEELETAKSNRWLTGDAPRGLLSERVIEGQRARGELDNQTRHLRGATKDLVDRTTALLSAQRERHTDLDRRLRAAGARVQGDAAPRSPDVARAASRDSSAGANASASITDRAPSITPFMSLQKAKDPVRLPAGSLYDETVGRPSSVPTSITPRDREARLALNEILRLGMAYRDQAALVQKNKIRSILLNRLAPYNTDPLRYPLGQNGGVVSIPYASAPLFFPPYPAPYGDFVDIRFEIDIRLGLILYLRYPDGFHAFDIGDYNGKQTPVAARARLLGRNAHLLGLRGKIQGLARRGTPVKNAGPERSAASFVNLLAIGPAMTAAYRFFGGSEIPALYFVFFAAGAIFLHELAHWGESILRGGKGRLIVRRGWAGGFSFMRSRGATGIVTSLSGAWWAYEAGAVMGADPALTAAAVAAHLILAVSLLDWIDTFRQGRKHLSSRRRSNEYALKRSA